MRKTKMIDPISMTFSLNQAALNTAISAALPTLLKELEFTYTSGRAPKGLTADVTINEAMIRKAVESYARRTVNSSFNHFSIEFQATRGEDGVIANITASSAPIQPEEPKVRQAVVTEDDKADAAEVDADPAPAAQAEEAVTEQAEVSQDPVEAEEAEAPQVAPAPARSKLFGDMKRPSNEASE